MIEVVVRVKVKTRSKVGAKMVIDDALTSAGINDFKILEAYKINSKSDEEKENLAEDPAEFARFGEELEWW